MQRRQLVQASALALLSAPAFVRAQSGDKTMGTLAVGGKQLLVRCRVAARLRPAAATG